MNDNEGSFAGILTLGTRFRRISGGRAPFFALRLFWLLTLVVAAGGAMASGTAGGTQPVSDITGAAENYLRQRLEGSGRQVTPRAGRLDPRLQLPLCDTTLQGYLRPGSKIDSRTVVGVRCSGSQPWKVYVPVDVIELRTVLVARRSLPRDHLLVAGDLAAEERDVSRIMGGYVADPEFVVGQRLKRRVVSGSVIAPSMLQEQIVVQRGQMVTLVVRDSALNISMAGTALMDGALNQRIRVENSTSDRIVEGIVRSPQYVEVLVR